MILSLANLSFAQALSYLLALVSAILVALSCHEFAHAFVAVKQGDPTPKAFRRLTLKPFNHVDLFGFVSLLLVGFGWAKPVPVNSSNFKHGRASSFAVSIAGVVTNIILALISAGLYVAIFKFFPKFFAGDNFYSGSVMLFLEFSILINVSLAVFNLLPIYPLDGFRIVESFAGSNNGYSNFMRRYYFIVLLLLYLTGVIYYAVSYLGGALFDALISLWCLIFGV